ncbi:MAG: DUF1648 domain-containing protein [Acidobacteria bacterium]|nr:DUF1648 domain-containing protein [Acidobacteriota bacterium]
MSNTVENSTRYFKGLTALAWTSVPAALALYVRCWNRLPARLATHFDFNNHPNGWMSREGAFVFTLALVTLVTAGTTWILSRVGKPDPAAWGLLAFCGVMLVTLLWVTDAVIDYNVYGQPLHILPAVAISMVAASLLVPLALLTRRSVQLTGARVFAEETHSSAIWGLVLALPAAFLAALALRIPLPAVRALLGLSMLMILAGAAMAWSGFHYQFSSAGVEIRTLGFRMRSIAARDIQSYSSARWSSAGGYGIRGVGSRRAYVWGNAGVRIKTREGEVFLGHDQPETLVRDLDRIIADRDMHERNSDRSS